MCICGHVQCAGCGVACHVMLVGVSLLGQLDAKHEVWVLHARVDHALKQDRQTDSYNAHVSANSHSPTRTNSFTLTHLTYSRTHTVTDDTDHEPAIHFVKARFIRRPGPQHSLNLHRVEGWRRELPQCDRRHRNDHTCTYDICVNTTTHLRF